MDLVLLLHDSVKKARSWSVLCEEVAVRLQCRWAAWICMPEHFEEQCVRRTLHRRSHLQNFDLLLKIIRYVNKICEFLKIIIWLHTAARNTFSSGIYKRWWCERRALMHTTTGIKTDRPDWFDSSPYTSLCHSHTTSCLHSGIVEWKQMKRSLKYLYSKYEDVRRKRQRVTTLGRKQCRRRARTKYELQLWGLEVEVCSFDSIPPLLMRGVLFARHP